MEDREEIIVIEHVSKIFGENKVLDDVCVCFEKGRIHGIIGRNGSGKTMLMKCICGFVPVTSGSIQVRGKKVGKDIDVPQNMGIIIETPGFLNGYSGYNNLKFLANINNKISEEKIIETLKLVKLDPHNKKHVGKYSLGMRQRLGLAQALMEDPDILILDEPMNGLDQSGVEEMREVLAALAKKGTTILMANHNAEDIEILCDTVHEMDLGVISRVK